MRSILLSAGYGKRLKPFTNVKPKCLMPINGKPLLEIWLDNLIKYNLGPFLINAHYLHEQVKFFIDNYKHKNKITFVFEPKLMGTAGTLINNIDFYKDIDGLLIHSDNYCLANFNDFIKNHFSRPKKCLFSMMTFRTKKISSSGIVKTDHDNVMIEYAEKPNHSNST